MGSKIECTGWPSHSSTVAKIADSSIAFTAKDKSGKLTLYSNGVGNTKVDIIEKLNGNERNIGTVNLTVVEMPLYNAVYGAMNEYYNGQFAYVWIKADLTGKTFDLNALFKKVLVGNEKIGTKFKEDDSVVFCTDLLDGDLEEMEETDDD